MIEVGELLVAESGGFTQRAGRAHPANGGVFVRETGFEGHEKMATVLDVVGDALKKSVVGDVECGNDEDLVGGEVLRLRKDEVGADVELIERVVELLQERGVVGGPMPECPLATP